MSAHGYTEREGERGNRDRETKAGRYHRKWANNW